MYDDTMLKEIHRATVEVKRGWWKVGEKDTMPVIGIGFDRHDFVTADLYAFLTMFGEMLQRERDPEEREKMLRWGVPFAIDTTLAAVAKVENRGSGWAQLALDTDDLPAVGDRITELWFSFDGFGKVTTEEGMAQMGRGDMEKDFRANPASEVRQVLTTFVYLDSEDGAESASVRTFYSITDGGKMLFEDPEISRERPEGTLHDVLVPYVGREVTQ